MRFMVPPPVRRGATLTLRRGGLFQTLKRDVRERRRTAARQRTVVGRVISENDRKLGVCRRVGPGGVEEPAVEEKHVTGVELYGGGAVEERLILRQVLPEKLRLVQPLGAEFGGVAPRQHEETAVFETLGPERDPHRHELRALERPVAEVPMPARTAAVARILRHDAVVMRLRKLDRIAKQWRKQASKLRAHGPLGKYRVACVSLEQPPHR